MARHMVGDDQKVYRVVIVSKVWWCESDRSWSEGPDVTETYGPYNGIGAARGQLTALAKDRDGNLRPHVVSAKVQLAHTTWEDVT